MMMRRKDLKYKQIVIQKVDRSKHRRVWIRDNVDYLFEHEKYVTGEGSRNA